MKKLLPMCVVILGLAVAKYFFRFDIKGLA